MKKIKIFTTGGTIVSTGEQGATPTLSGKDLIACIPGINDIADIVIEDFSKVPSTEMTPELMLQLARKVEKSLQDDSFDGVVITHGTDTMEETAYLHELVIDNKKPIVFTGAMRPASALSADGPANLLNAIIVASEPKSMGYPPLIVLNEEIHIARYATKYHTSALESFTSMECGPAGVVKENNVFYFYEVPRKSVCQPENIKANVEIIKVSAGSSDFLLKAAIQNGCEGIVIEGTGAGHVPSAWTKSIRKAIQAGVIIIVVSRSPGGYPLKNTYGMPGGEIHLRELGVIFGHSNAPKTRLFLCLAISAGWNKGRIEEFYKY